VFFILYRSSDKMGILFTILMGIPLTITMGILFTMVLGIQLTISTLLTYILGRPLQGFP
jgi:hypothetical protein